MLSFDKNLFLGLYNLGQKNKSLYNTAKSITKLSEKIFPCFYVILLSHVLYNKGLFITFIFIFVPLTILILNIFLRKLFKRQRPYKYFNLDINREGKSSENSFPSNHAASSAIIALAFFMVNSYLGIFLFCFSFLTGISRIILGLHYPFDILAGWFSGIFIGFAMFFILKF